MVNRGKELRWLSEVKYSFEVEFTVRAFDRHEYTNAEKASVAAKDCIG